MLVKHILTEKNTHLGAVAKFGYVHLPNHHELYLTKEIKQRFKVLGIPFKQTTTQQTIQFPLEVVSLMVHATSLEGEGLLHMDFENYRTTTLQVAEEVRENARKAIKASDELSDQQKHEMLAHLREDERNLEALFNDLQPNEKVKFASFTQDGYELVYRVISGSSVEYFFAKVLDDRISFFIIDTMQFNKSKTRKEEIKFSGLKSFYMTQQFMLTFLKKVQEKEVKL